MLKTQPFPDWSTPQQRWTAVSSCWWSGALPWMAFKAPACALGALPWSAVDLRTERILNDRPLAPK